MFGRHFIVGAMFALSVSAPLFAQTPDVEFFESKIRPVLVQRCYSCHNSKMAAPKGDLILDTKEGLLKGGSSGPGLVPGNPAESRLLKVLSYTDPLVQMPPSGKLADAVLQDFTQWVATGAVDPRVSAPALASASPQYKGMSLEEGRKWWAFQPVAAHAAPQSCASVRTSPPTRSTTSSPPSSPRRSSNSRRRRTNARSSRERMSVSWVSSRRSRRCRRSSTTARRTPTRTSSIAC